MQKFIIIIAIAIQATLMYAQPPGNSSAWATLGMVTFETKYDKEFGYETKKPTLSPIVKALEGKELEVDGYIIPLNGKLEQNHFMLSKFTNNMCFFCGKAGPETAMQVFLSNNKKVAYSDDKIKVKGILRINTHDASGLLYTLENAVVIKL